MKPAVLFALLVASCLPGAASAEAPSGTPAATVDLATRAGVAMMSAAWRYHDVTIAEVDFRAPGADRKPSGPPNRTYDFMPHAGAADFDDSAWEVIDPTILDARRSGGKLCFNWYRTRITIPERLGEFGTRGATVTFEIVVDDYAEVWVDGALPRTLGQRGGSLVAGWNAPNRVVLGRDVQPGQSFQIAVFGMNGPVSEPPSNYIWVRSAKLEFHRPLGDPLALAGGGDVQRLEPVLDAIVPPEAKIEKLADGFGFGEGPVWTGDALLFSDPNTNVVYRYDPSGQVSVFRRNSGYSGADVGRLRQPGSNGLAVDREGRLTLCEHGNRRVTRIERDGSVTVLADRYQGKRLNSPNDLVYRSDGALYFTDPPFGLPRFHDDPEREQPHFGVYCLKDGKLSLVSTDLRGPNGLAFSPDERYLYVANWDEKKKVVMRYDVRADGTLRLGRVFYDMTSAPGEEALDGLKVDQRGNLYVSGPGGVWILSPEAKHLGTIRAPALPANLAWGDADRRTLYMTARSGLYRMRVAVPGAGVRAIAATTAQ